MSPKWKSALLQVLLAAGLVGTGIALALLGVRPRCCPPSSVCTPSVNGAEAGGR
jgi:hypothetical protein